MVEAWEETKRQRRIEQRRRRSLNSSPSSPPRSRVRRSRRPQIISSPSQGTNRNEQTVQSISSPLNLTDFQRSASGFRVCKRFSHVEVTRPTPFQRARYGAPALPPALEVPDSQPESLPSRQLSIPRSTKIRHTKKGLGQTSSSPSKAETFSQANHPERLAKEVEPSYLQLNSTPILQPTRPYERSRDSSSSPLKTPSPLSSTSQAFETQIAISRNDPIPTIEGEEYFVLEDDEQDGQGVGYYLPPDSIADLGTLSFTGSGRKEAPSSFSHRKLTVLSDIDLNLQPSHSSHTQWGKSHTQLSKVSDDQFVSIRSYWTTPIQTAQENIEQSIHHSAQEISQDMAAFRPMNIATILSQESPRQNSSPTGRQDQLRDGRARSAANTAALRRGIEAGQARQDTRSPSIIPEPIQYRPVGDSRLEPQIVELPLPRHPTQLSPHAPHKSSKLSSPPQTAQVDIITQLEPPELGGATYIVPLSLPGRVRDQYLSTIGDYQKATNSLVSVPYPDAATVKDVETMLIRLNNVSNHVDLDDDTTLGYRPMEDEFKWAVTASFKFRFLDHLLEHLQHDDVHIAIIAQQGRLLDILGRFIGSSRMANLTKLDAARQIVEQTRVDGVSTPLRISLLTPGNLRGDLNNLYYADLLIAFDSTFDSSAPGLSALRRHPAMPGRLSPVIYPMVYAAVEHIERCVPTMKSSIDQLRVVTQCVLQTRQEIGELQPEEAKTDAAAEEVASFIRLGGQEGDWTLSQIRNIQLVGLELQLANQGYTPIAGIEQVIEPAGRKRHVVS